MPVSRGTGRRYAAGSSQTPAVEMPRVCERCGGRIYTSRESFEHRVDVAADGALTHRAWHLNGVCERAPADAADAQRSA